MIITVCNQKGGVGKTTTTALLCKALLHAKKRVLAIDCDSQGGLSDIFGATNKKGLWESLSNLCSLPESIETINGLDICRGDYKLDDIFASIDPYALTRLLKKIKGNYEYIIIDTPPTMQGLSRASVIASDSTLVPCEISATAYEPTLYTTKKIKELKKKYKVLFLGYKKPTNNGYHSTLCKKYKKAFGACLSIPKRLTTPKLAMLNGHPSKQAIEIYKTLLKGIKQ